jgi:hypothetical protein
MVAIESQTINTNYGEQFVIKVQANADKFPIMIYDQTRICQFRLPYGQKGFSEVLAAV